MAISGLVISTRTAAQAAAVAATLGADSRFSCGPLRANRLAAVLDTCDEAGDDAGDEEVCRWLWTLDGVVLVDVAAVHWSPSPGHRPLDAAARGGPPAPILKNAVRRS